MSDFNFFQISISHVNWPDSSAILGAIRYEVFVKEQNVPAELEMDQYDATAKHWLASAADGEPLGTVRLITADSEVAKVGRLAVYAQHRHKGVGAALLRRVIHDAASAGILKLSLAAQLSTIGFYETLGFKADGPEFDDAGIAHKNMELDLGPFRHLAKDDRHHDTAIEGRQQVSATLASLITSAKRNLALYSLDLDRSVYSTEALLAAITALATQQDAVIQILVADTAAISAAAHPLHELAQRLTSHIEIRKLSPEYTTNLKDFAVIDSTAWLRLLDRGNFSGFANANNPAQACHLLQQFTELWRHSLPDPQIRRFNL